MLTNKIQKYILKDIIKNFLTILLTFTAIAWTVRAVNFLDLIIEDGFNPYVYFKYSILNLSAILTRFTPLSFLIGLLLTIIKLEKQQEFLILWTTGLNKIKIANTFILISVLITLIQILMTFYLNPFLLSKSRILLKTQEDKEISSVLRSNNFNDSFKGITFFIEKKNENNELINIFVQDDNGTLNLAFDEVKSSKNTIIIAKKGIIKNNKLLLFEGNIQTKNNNNELKNFFFEKTELNIKNFNSRTITDIKVQETNSLQLINCIFNIQKTNLQNCSADKKEAIEHMSRRVIKPLYITLIALLSSFLLIYKKEKKTAFVKKYFIFFITFIILILSEILLKFSGLSKLNFFIYLLIPIILFSTIYILLVITFNKEKISS
ncbi:MAG: LptF/LptG family permease [Pelagibacteraceae bacterium]